MLLAACLFPLVLFCCGLSFFVLFLCSHPPLSHFVFLISFFPLSSPVSYYSDCPLLSCFVVLRCNYLFLVPTCLMVLSRSYRPVLSILFGFRIWFDWLQRDKKAPPRCLLSNHSLPWDKQEGLMTGRHQTGCRPAGVLRILRRRMGRRGWLQLLQNRLCLS